MATKIITQLLDDIDETKEAAETVTFALDGTTYEMDLTEENAQSLRSLIGTWAQYARVTSRTAATKPRSRRPANGDYDPVKVREWAETQGIALSARGRIAADVIQAYKIGHSHHGQ